MITYKEVKDGDFRIVSIQCDICKVIAKTKSEADEFIHIEFMGGYDSK